MSATFKQNWDAIAQLIGAELEDVGRFISPELDEKSMVSLVDELETQSSLLLMALKEDGMYDFCQQLKKDHVTDLYSMLEALEDHLTPQPENVPKNSAGSEPGENLEQELEALIEKEFPIPDKKTEDKIELPMPCFLSRDALRAEQLQLHADGSAGFDPQEIAQALKTQTVPDLDPLADLSAVLNITINPPSDPQQHAFAKGAAASILSGLRQDPQTMPSMLDHLKAIFSPSADHAETLTLTDPVEQLRAARALLEEKNGLPAILWPEEANALIDEYNTLAQYWDQHIREIARQKEVEIAFKPAIHFPLLDDAAVLTSDLPAYNALAQIQISSPKRQQAKLNTARRSLIQEVKQKGIAAMVVESPAWEKINAPSTSVIQQANNLDQLTQQLNPDALTQKAIKLNHFRLSNYTRSLQKSGVIANGHTLIKVMDNMKEAYIRGKLPADTLMKKQVVLLTQLDQLYSQHKYTDVSENVLKVTLPRQIKKGVTAACEEALSTKVTNNNTLLTDGVLLSVSKTSIGRKNNKKREELPVLRLQAIDQKGRIHVLGQFKQSEHPETSLTLSNKDGVDSEVTGHTLAGANSLRDGVVNTLPLERINTLASHLCITPVENVEVISGLLINDRGEEIAPIKPRSGKTHLYHVTNDQIKQLDPSLLPQLSEAFSKGPSAAELRACLEPHVAAAYQTLVQSELQRIDNPRKIDKKTAKHTDKAKITENEHRVSVSNAFNTDLAKELGKAVMALGVDPEKMGCHQGVFSRESILSQPYERGSEGLAWRAAIWGAREHTATDPNRESPTFDQQKSFTSTLVRTLIADIMERGLTMAPQGIAATSKLMPITLGAPQDKPPSPAQANQTPSQEEPVNDPHQPPPLTEEDMAAHFASIPDETDEGQHYTPSP
jgi:hypothetical protein